MQNRPIHLIFLLATIAPMARFNRSRSPEQDRLECKANLKVIATAAEMYSLDNAQRYPDSLRGLEGRYLKKAGDLSDNGPDYSESYRVVTSPTPTLSAVWAGTTASRDLVQNSTAVTIPSVIRGWMQKMA